jgi:hypothetical protein
MCVGCGLRSNKRADSEAKNCDALTLARKRPTLQAPDYAEIVKHPMNFKEMQRKLAAGRYASFEPFEADFRLICSNCMVYNKPDTIYYKEAAKLLAVGLDRIAVAKAKWEGACAARWPPIPALWRPRLNRPERPTDSPCPCRCSLFPCPAHAADLSRAGAAAGADEDEEEQQSVPAGRGGARSATQPPQAKRKRHDAGDAAAEEASVVVAVGDGSAPAAARGRGRKVQFAEGRRKGRDASSPHDAESAAAAPREAGRQHREQQPQQPQAKGEVHALSGSAGGIPFLAHAVTFPARLSLLTGVPVASGLGRSARAPLFHAVPFAVPAVDALRAGATAGGEEGGEHRSGSGSSGVRVAVDAERDYWPDEDVWCCAVCDDATASADNALVQCGNPACGVIVHQTCYGACGRCSRWRGTGAGGKGRPRCLQQQPARKSTLLSPSPPRHLPGDLSLPFPPPPPLQA